MVFEKLYDVETLDASTSAPVVNTGQTHVAQYGENLSGIAIQMTAYD